MSKNNEEILPYVIRALLKRKRKGYTAEEIRRDLLLLQNDHQENLTSEDSPDSDRETEDVKNGAKREKTKKNADTQPLKKKLMKNMKSKKSPPAKYNTKSATPTNKNKCNPKPRPGQPVRKASFLNLDISQHNIADNLKYLGDISGSSLSDDANMEQNLIEDKLLEDKDEIYMPVKENEDEKEECDKEENKKNLDRDDSNETDDDFNGSVVGNKDTKEENDFNTIT